MGTTKGSLTFKARPAVSRTECSSSKSALLKTSAGACDLVGIDERSCRSPISAACVSWLSSSGVAGGDGGGAPVSSAPAPEKAVDRASMVLQTASRTSCQCFCFHVRILVVCLCLCLFLFGIRVLHVHMRAFCRSWRRSIYRCPNASSLDLFGANMHTRGIERRTAKHGDLVAINDE